MQREEFMTVAEVAAALRISTRSVQGLCNEGSLPSRRVGRLYRILREDFDTFRLNAKVEHKTVEIGQVFEAELSALVQAWLKEMEIGARPCSPDTIKTHQKHLYKFVRVLLGDDATARLEYKDAVTEKSLGRVMARLPVTQFATRYNVYMALMAFSRFLVVNGFLVEAERTAMKRHRPKRLVPPRRTALNSSDEVNRFIEAIWMNEAYTVYEKTLNCAAISIMVFAGLRVSEVAGLELAHVDLANDLIFVHCGKGGQARMVGINPRLKDALQAYKRMRSQCTCDRFLVSAIGTPLNRDALDKRIRRISKRTGLKVSAHGLRRTFATLNANAGKSLNMIQLALGHKDISTTQAYLMADQRAAAREMRSW